MDKLTQFKTHYAEAVKSFNEKMSYEELKIAIQALIDFVKKLKENTAAELQTIKVMLSSATAKMESDQNEEMTEMKKQATNYCEKEMNKMYFEHESMITIMDKKMDDIKPLEPVDTSLIAKQASEIATSEVLKLIPPKDDFNAELSKAGDLIADTISGLLEVKDIKGLEELLEELRQLRTQRLGGGGFSAIAMQQHFIPWTETSVAPNGVLTDFVIAYTPNPTNSLEVMVDNSPLFLTSDWTYTAATKTIVFNVAPPLGSIIRYKSLI